jgi:hypothetical protein
MNHEAEFNKTLGVATAAADMVVISEPKLVVLKVFSTFSEYYHYFPRETACLLKSQELGHKNIVECLDYGEIKVPPKSEEVKSSALTPKKGVATRKQTKNLTMTNQVQKSSAVVPHES